MAAILLMGIAALAASVSITMNAGAFRVAGPDVPKAAPPGGWGAVFAVYAGSGDVPAMAGRYAVENGVLVFRPQYPAAAGVHYRAVFRPAKGAPVEQRFDGPARDAKPMAHVERIYPSGDVLPSNQLRIYIYFSAPMSQGEAAKHLHLLDAAGKDVRDVFLPGEELWDPGFRRLTITLDPGRIKRGLTSNMAIGPPLTEGRAYALVIDKEWQDARGVAMVESYRKAFRGGPSERKKPDPKQWKIAAPAAGSSAPLVVAFAAPMNYVLATRMITVQGVPGTASVEKGETEWRFTPQRPWQAGSYKLLVDTALEDRAGNSVEQAFDIDVFDKVTQQIDVRWIPLDFVIR
jgi:hypothetical protein